MKITTATDLETLADTWRRFEIVSPHASLELFTVVHDALGEQPHVLLLEEDGREPILVVARVERRPVRVKAGYRTLFTAPARWLVVVAGGIVGARTADDYRAVMRALTASLRRGDADILQLSKVPVDGPLAEVAASHLSWLRRGHGAAPQVHHTSDLSGGLDSLLSRRSKGTRWRIRKRLKKLGDPEAKMSVRRIGPDDAEDDVVRILDSIASGSYQRGIGVGFADDPLHRAFVRWAIAGGAYKIWLLSLEGTPVAYLNGLTHHGTFHLFETAFDAARADDEPGAILLARVLQELADDPAVDGFDYGYGDAQYKSSMSDASWDETDVLFFAARPRALSLNLLNTGAATAVGLGKRVLGGERVAAMRKRKRAELSQGDA
ncbi:GNAT family N-acetyltransferase [Actinoplanes sp. TBRC 11911]|uniref:GNAT family N-acetyltransferase n=1 Tax=Actinoplanes sp. TBRC 11911 TaxID=2729386 RepID=UPI00145F29A9|nr:GNAT family N-acetyltransferase [Actinoplanes sp. TBRC 11911]NMO57798.1 GNAT family N-acetyltransferase [Actinoplanes sp. TBRC 11911]